MVNLYLHHIVCKAILMVGMLSLLQPAAEAQPAVETGVPKIEWRVENPFPFLRNIQDFRQLKLGLAKIHQNEDFGAYASAVSASYGNTAWDRSNRTYDRELIHSDVLVIEARLTSAPSGSLCIWTGVSTGEPSACDAWKRIKIKLDSQNNLSVKWLHNSNPGNVLTITAIPQRKVIVGLGDSFSSGEGNPDRPSKWDENRIDEKEARHYQRRWALNYKPTSEEMADWNDVSCHRSLYSWQFLHALNQAGNDPHEIVSFVPFACSGAEIYDGLLVQQRDRKNRPKAPDSQINEAVSLLCRTQTKLEKYGTRKHSIGKRDVEIVVRKCPEGDLVSPDEILMTIGGNDIGFGGLISWASFPDKGYTWVSSKTIMRAINNSLMPKTGMACPEKTSRGDWRCKVLFSAREALTSGWLAENLRFTQDLLFSHLKVRPEQVRHLNYAVPVRDESGEVCNFGRAADSSRVMKNELFSEIEKKLGFIESIASPLIKNRYNAFSVGPLGFKVNDIEDLVVKDLQATIADVATRGVKTIDVASEFATHGYCARSSRWELEMVTKFGQKSSGWQWWPSSNTPSKYDAWKRTERWFRTPNDAQLTMLADSVYGPEAWMSGIFHPNHLGHYSMYLTLSKKMTPNLKVVTDIGVRK